MKEKASARAARPALPTPFEGPQPRYLALAETLSRAIKSGDYKVGSLLPPEADLCEQFGVSRHTIREAIRKLKDLGLVSRHQGVGTRVESADISGRYVMSLGTIPDIWRYVQATRIKLLSRAVIDAKDAPLPLPEIGGDNRWLMLEMVRYITNQPQPNSLTAVFVNGAYQGIPKDIERRSQPIFSLVEEKYGLKVTRIQQEISAICLNRTQARLLETAAGQPALSILRHYFAADGTVIEVGRSITPADRFTYSIDVQLEFATARGKN